jgi:hypothetical protein
MEYDRDEMNMSVRKSIAHLQHHHLAWASLSFFFANTINECKTRTKLSLKKNLVEVQGCVHTYYCYGIYIPGRLARAVPFGKLERLTIAALHSPHSHTPCQNSNVREHVSLT